MIQTNQAVSLPCGPCDPCDHGLDLELEIQGFQVTMHFSDTPNREVAARIKLALLGTVRPDMESAACSQSIYEAFPDSSTTARENG